MMKVGSSFKSREIKEYKSFLNKIFQMVGDPTGG